MKGITMSFEPTYPECEECHLYRLGDGKSTISRCLAEEGHEPSEFCPITTRLSVAYCGYCGGIEGEGKGEAGRCPVCGGP